MFQMVYLSEYAGDDIERDLAKILETARRHNEPAAITGLLLYLAGSFIQVLEGDAEAVRALFGRICADPRHRQVVVLLEHEVARRLFPDWSMGYVPVSEAEFTRLAEINRCDYETLSAMPSNIVNAIILNFTEAKLAEVQ